VSNFGVLGYFSTMFCYDTYHNHIFNHEANSLVELVQVFSARAGYQGYGFDEA
jgi:hypothetical protein